MTDPVEIYLYANCSSCREAVALLRQAGVPAIRRDLFDNRLAAEELRALFARIGLEPQEVLSTRSRPYAALRLAARSLTAEEIVRLMAEHPALIRRPIVVKAGRAVVGLNRPALVSLLSS